MASDVPLRLDPAHLSVVAEHEDPRYAELIKAALGGARSIVNVWAGAGAYEPEGSYVVPIEPRAGLAERRGGHQAPAIRASPGALPLFDDSVDAAMAIRAVHEWGTQREAGVREMRRVARGPVVIMTLDLEVSSSMWLAQDYLPQLAQLNGELYPDVEQVVDWLGGTVEVLTVPVPRDSTDWPLSSAWAKPERLCGPEGRARSRTLALLPPDVVDHGLQKLERDLLDGRWDRRHGHLRALYEHDVGLRLIVGHPSQR
ncbi:MAG: methyltransferase type 11 [Solirubrobacteraceae bacterium]|jgi:hypothetical protein